MANGANECANGSNDVLTMLTGVLTDVLTDGLTDRLTDWLTDVLTVLK